MRRILIIVFAIVGVVSTLQAATKRVAILDIIDTSNTATGPIKAYIHIAMSDEIAHLERYELCHIPALKGVNIIASTRIDELQAAALHKEHNINRLITVLLTYDSPEKITLNAALIELPSGLSMRSAMVSSSTTAEALIQASKNLVVKLLLPNKFVEDINSINMQMVFVEGDTFEMGLNNAPSITEQPAHTVTLSNYYIGATEVTQAQWRLIMGNNPSHHRGDALPVDGVTWEEAQLFCKRLSEMTGRHYTLPTEAQWEYAARGGVDTPYSGSTNISEVAWHSVNSSQRSHPVALKQPNAFGLYDMSGNIWEWCSDWFAPYNSNKQHNPTGPQSGSERVLRGGSWIIDAEYCRTTYRNANAPDTRERNYGFRVVCIP